jgi:nucleotide-binding universal stress UspA family protein
VIDFKLIICPVDFSESSVRALAYGAALARWYDAQLTVLHVVPTFERCRSEAISASPFES